VLKLNRIRYHVKTFQKNRTNAETSLRAGRKPFPADRVADEDGGGGARKTGLRPQSPERRQILLAGLAGPGAAMTTLTVLMRRRNDSTPGQIHPAQMSGVGARPAVSGVRRGLPL
jgi:hypothetical protein